MRDVLLALAGLITLVGAVLVAPGLAHADCAQIRSSCSANCARTESAARLSACLNRCAIIFCQDPPSVCRPTDESVCNTEFRSCEGACESLASIPSAIVQDQLACSRTCCVRFKACLQLRSCDVSSIVCP